MQILDKLAGKRVFIWSLVIIVVALVSLATYIFYVTAKDQSAFSFIGFDLHKRPALAGKASVDDLASALRKAHETKNTAAFLGLYFDLSKVDARTIDSLKSEFASDLPSKIQSVTINKPNPKDYAPYVGSNGLTYQPQLPIIKVISMNYKTSTGTVSTGFPVGTSQGRYFLVTVIPVETAAGSSHCDLRTFTDPVEKYSIDYPCNFVKYTPFDGKIFDQDTLRLYQGNVLSSFIYDNGQQAGTNMIGSGIAIGKIATPPLGCKTEGLGQKTIGSTTFYYGVGARITPTIKYKYNYFYVPHNSDCFMIEMAVATDPNSQKPAPDQADLTQLEQILETTALTFRFGSS